MQCPFCGHDESKVIDSRESPDGIRRRRECRGCDGRFTTYERVHATPLVVVKRDQRREEFSTEKLASSIRLACVKRPLETGAIDKTVRDIEAELAGMGKAEVESRVVGEMVMERLRELDRVAYIRFASVYRDFEDIDSFEQELEALRENTDAAPAAPPQLRLIDDDVPRLSERRRARHRRGRRAARQDEHANGASAEQEAG